MNIYFHFHSSFGVEHFVYIVHIISMVFSVVCTLMKAFSSFMLK